MLKTLEKQNTLNKKINKTKSKYNEKLSEQTKGQKMWDTTREASCESVSTNKYIVALYNRFQVPIYNTMNLAYELKKHFCNIVITLTVNINNKNMSRWKCLQLRQWKVIQTRYFYTQLLRKQ